MKKLPSFLKVKRHGKFPLRIDGGGYFRMKGRDMSGMRNTTKGRAMAFDPVVRAASLIAAADSLLITAGAGMGVDSGLPDFRGVTGFWQAYPALAKARMDFESIANPSAFRDMPRRAWGFYGHRLSLYRQTVPHEGFDLLRKIASQLSKGSFVVTSNVDGQFQKAGFPDDRVLEIHGSIHWLQCSVPCRQQTWSAREIQPAIDRERCEWIGHSLPSCPDCGSLARPNILMFDDWKWINERKEIQYAHFNAWQETTNTPVVIELGAGLGIPSIRRISESRGIPLIRVNPRDDHIPYGAGVSLRMGARQALRLISRELEWEAADTT